MEPLETRIQTHRQYSESPDDVEAAVARAVVLGTRDDLLDVGCGTGSYLRRLSVAGHQGQLVGLDASPAAIAALDGVDGVSAHLGDAAALPFRDSVFDTVTARHMLYHVPDVTGAITEARRVLRPGGRFAAIVNHPDVTPRVSALVRDVVTAAGVRIPVVPNSRLHSGNLPEMIGATFGDVVVHRYDNALVFDRPEPVIAFTLAQLSFYGVEPDSPLRLELARVIDGKVRSWFADAAEPWRDPKGYVVCLARRQPLPRS